LTGFVAGLARKTVSHNVTINNLLPGQFDTDRLQKTIVASASATGKNSDDVFEARRKQIPAQRFGNPAEFGAVCAFLCSMHAGYMTGQNVLLDGGNYPGTF
jgi:3-oxoacyl-[acyl-carrier protein] reductase